MFFANTSQQCSATCFQNKRVVGHVGLGIAGIFERVSPEGAWGCECDANTNDAHGEDDDDDEAGDHGDDAHEDEARREKRRGPSREQTR